MDKKTADKILAKIATFQEDVRTVQPGWENKNLIRRLDLIKEEIKIRPAAVIMKELNEMWREWQEEKDTYKSVKTDIWADASDAARVAIEEKILEDLRDLMKKATVVSTGSRTWPSQS